MDELVERLEALGHEVIVNGSPDHVLPPLRPLPSRLGRVVNSLPYLVAWYVVMLFRWRRLARRRMTSARADEVLVWDQLLALLARVARPKGTQVTWVHGTAEGAGTYQRVLRGVVALTADRVITTFAAESRLVVGRDVVVPMALPQRTSHSIVPGWVVFGSTREPSTRSVELLRARAASDPASALIFNLRDQDDVSPQTLALLRDAAAPRAVWWVSGSQWADRLGGVPSVAIDPSNGLDVDHRHLFAASSGATLLASAENDEGFWNRVLRAEPHHSGWKELRLRDGAHLLTDEGDWLADVFAPREHDRVDALAEHAVLVKRCPVCGSDARRRELDAEGGITVVRCESCGLRYADRVLPPDEVHTDDYHSGKGTCGADYASDVVRPFVEAVADHRLDALASLGLAPGSLLDVGAGLGHLVARASARGWRAEGLEIVPAAAQAARRTYGVTMHVGELSDLPPNEYDVVTLGQTLEHMHDPVGVLDAIRQKHLVPGGHVLIEVPNVRSLARYIQRGGWMHWQPGDHHVYPDLKTSKDILERAGFDVRFLRSDSLATDGLSEAVVAYNLGLVSHRVMQRWPQLGRVLQVARAERPLRLLTAIVDRVGFGQNVLAIGRAR
ncbi:MAG: hypothetical protein QOK28_1897 [Actinomycetota bacterium]|jgi:SAM-dependent methyltransferase